MVVELRLTSKHDDLIGWAKRITRRTIPDAGRAVTRRMAEDIKNVAVFNVIERTQWEGTGRLSKSIHVKDLSTAERNSFSVVADAPYAMFVERGTKPHLVSNQFRFGPYWNTGTKGERDTGGWYMHSGARPMNFMKDAFDEVLANWFKYVDESFKIDIG